MAVRKNNQRTTKRKRNNRSTRNTKSKKKNSYLINIIGLFIVLISVLALFKFGIVGRFFADVYRLFVGNTFQVFATIFVIVGLAMFILGKVPRLGFKRYFGLFLLAAGCLAIVQGVFFQHLGVKNDLNSVTWRLIAEDFRNNQVANNIGGGMIGSFLFSLLKPLFSTIGTFFISGLAVLTGFLMFLNVSIDQIITGIQKAYLAIRKSFFNAQLDHQQNKQERIEERKQEQLSEDPQPKTHNFSVPVMNNFVHKSEPKQPQQKEPEKKDDDFHIEGPKTNKIKTGTANVSKSPSDAVGDLNIGNKDDGNYTLPSPDLLTKMPQTDQSSEYEQIQKNRTKLKDTLESFGVKVEVKKATLGPTVTRYEIQPAVGVKVSKIANLADDLALALSAKDIRIEAPIPGKPYVGIEVPNKHPSIVSFRDVVEHEPSHRGKILSVPLGKDVNGNIAMCNITKLPHLLIAGSTGSGKSVAINTIITGILMQARPSEVKFILIDPKMVELSVYNGIPHLIIPVVTDAKRATSALQKAVNEMERRYKLFEKTTNRNINEYNSFVEENNKNKNNPALSKLPYIVIIIDELSDLMMVAGHEVEVLIVRLTQKARAAGMHLIIATQRPSVDVITGLIKANVPSRIAFAVSSNVDSRTILDAPGAEKLLGRGDMLFEPIGMSKPERIQGAYISSEDVEKVVQFVSSQQKVEYDQSMIPSDDDKPDKNQKPSDEYWDDAVELVVHGQKASVSMLQRRFAIGYNRAARLVDNMEERGIVGPSKGSKPRKVLINHLSSGEDKNNE